jgi:hypothetical protein
MHSIAILERRCPSCGHRRTVRLGQSSAPFCFNCRLRAGGRRATGTSPAGEPAVTYSLYPFDPAEWRRLRAYRAAVRAGFYTDRC